MIYIAEQLRSEIASAKWHVWHGNIHRALELLTGVSFGLDACAENDSRTKSGKMLDELRVYLDRNRATIPNYAERHLAGEPISSDTAEATVNLVIAKRMVKKQQMRWSPTGAHNMLQVRTPSPRPPTRPRHQPMAPTGDIRTRSPPPARCSLTSRET